MKKHWAPWRVEFLLGPKPKGCVFCVLPREKQDESNLILHRGQWNFIILNKYPYNNGHLMVVPYRHTNDLAKMRPEEYAEMMQLSSVSVKALEKSMTAQGFNLGMNLGSAGGAGIKDHLHMHVVPRWVGDTNFMPILFDTKVLIEHLSCTYQRLAPAIAKLLKASPKGKAVKAKNHVKQEVARVAIR